MSDAGQDALENAENVGITDAGDVTPSQEAPEDSGNSGTGHPAWQEILQHLPDSLHPVVTPALQKWDSNFQEKLQQVQSQYDPYRPFIEDGIEPGALQRALAVTQMIENNPQEFYRQMGEYYKFAQQQASDQGQGNEGEFDLSDDDDEYGEDANSEYAQKMQMLEQQQQIIAQALLSQHQQEEAAKADAALDAELKALEDKYGQFDMEYVLTRAAATGNVEGAVKDYMNLVARVKGTPAPGSNLPRPVAPSAGTPSTPINPAELNSSETRNLVADMLARMNNPTT